MLQIENVNFDECTLDLVEHSYDFIQFHISDFTVKVNGFGTQNVEKGTYIVYEIKFQSYYPNGLYAWLRVLVILNF